MRRDNSRLTASIGFLLGLTLLLGIYMFEGRNTTLTSTELSGNSVAETVEMASVLDFAAVRYRNPEVLTKPDGFPWMPDFVIKKLSSGKYETNLDMEQFAPPVKPGSKVYYVDVNIGSDSNSGLSPSVPFQSIYKALQKTDLDVLYIAPGLYDKNKGFHNISPKRDLVVKPTYKGKVIVSNHIPLTFEIDSTLAKVYMANVTLAEAAYDAAFVDDYGDYRPIEKVSSLEEVARKPGSWYTDGSTVWLRLADDRAPDKEVRVYVKGFGALINTSIHVYVEGIEFHGGEPFVVSNQSASDDIRVYLKDDAFRYSSSVGSNGLSIRGAREAIVINSVASHNRKDGFNYHAKNGIVPNVLEVDVIGRHNGVYGDQDSINNGSTMHNGGAIIRIGGFYFGNEGFNVADVTASKSWIIGSAAYNSASVMPTHRVNFLTEGTMWLDGSATYGYIPNITAKTGAAVYVRHTWSNGDLLPDTY